MLSHLPRNVIGNSKFQDLSRYNAAQLQIALTSIRMVACKSNSADEHCGER